MHSKDKSAEAPLGFLKFNEKACAILFYVSLTQASQADFDHGVLSQQW